MPRRFIPPLARRNAELPWGRLDRPNAFGRAGLTPQLQKPACERGDQLSDVSQTSSLRSVARILSADCLKMLRIRPLTASFPDLKIEN
jgi:hypothetical protein